MYVYFILINFDYCLHLQVDQIFQTTHSEVLQDPEIENAELDTISIIDNTGTMCTFMVTWCDIEDLKWMHQTVKHIHLTILYSIV